jgi:hypothetical protein
MNTSTNIPRAVGPDRSPTGRLLKDDGSLRGQGLHPVTIRVIDGRRLRVGPIEAIDGTPVIDIKTDHTWIRTMTATINSY